MLQEPALPEMPAEHTSRSHARFDVLFPTFFGFVYALLGVFVQLRFFPIGDLDLETDFYSDLVIAARKLWAGEASVQDFAWKGPLYALVLGPIRAVAGDWYRAAVVLSAVSAGASLWLVYRLVLRLFDRRTAVATMVAASLVVELFVQSHRATTDVFFLFLFLASMACTLLARKSLRRHAAAGALAALAFLTRYNGVFLAAGALPFLMFVNPDRLGRRARAKATAGYVAAFALVALPWFLVNGLQAGRPLATRNQETIVTTFFGDRRWQVDAAGPDATLVTLVLAHPAQVLEQFARNLWVHLDKNRKQLLGWPMALVPIVGVLGLVIRPPTRRQAGLYLFAAVFWLCMGVVFYTPRFFLPMIPAYLALGLSFFRSGDGWSSWLGRRVPWRRGIATVVLVAVLWILVVVHIPRIVSTERRIHARRPVGILEAARFLAEKEGHGQARVMARKGHIAYHAGFDFTLFFEGLTSLEALIERARSAGVDYVAYSQVEYWMLPRMLFLAVSDRVPYLAEVYKGDGIRVFRVEAGAEPVFSDAERYALLLATLKGARSQRRPASIYGALVDLGAHGVARREFERAAAHFREAVAVAERADDQREWGWRAAVAREQLAGAELEEGNFEAAVASLQANADYFASVGAQADLDRTTAKLQSAHAALRSWQRAAPERP